MKFPNSPPTLTLAERMPSEICKKHIHTGYRQPHQPWFYYVISVFHANNQTLNVWTHVIGFLFIAYKTYDMSLTFDFLNDPMYRPLGAGLLCILTLLAVSSFAHTFGDRSEVAHYTCFCMDFDAIGLYSMGCALISHTYFTTEKSLAKFLVKWSRPGCIYLAMQFSVLLSFSKLRFGRANKLCKVFQCFTVYSSYVWFMVPIIQRYFWPEHNYQDNTLGLHMYHIIYFQLNILIYSAHVPERWFPRTFDIIGQSHQLQHIAMVVFVNNFINVTTEEIKSSSSIKILKYMTRKLGTFENSYGAVMLVMYFNCFMVVLASLYAIIKVARSSDSAELTSTGKVKRSDLNDQAHVSNDEVCDEDTNTVIRTSTEEQNMDAPSDDANILKKSQ
ncbi:membrane progestin receptor alpha-like [Ylistrum balloti]|uniref:membrane progestin receptor alpha-like n=1 Tax=Ylistrum balloti TaxID=509963 RepID=UPI002905E67E|nr:membrane progestin receptor alpha-like [Ylistrum balloti]